MDIGERIQLTEEESDALRFGDVLLPRYWPVTREGFRDLEHLLFERIIDKRGLIDEMRQQNALHLSSEEVFGLRRELGVLYEAHDQLSTFALEQGFDLPGPEN
jgi:hypothetical protein